MYVKLFARITESSLMEQEIAVRYTFVMLLALADPSGLVVGTDIAISRRLNMPLKQFVKCAKALQAADEDSNSKEHEGRRIIPSEAERGYQIVNYAKYRDLQSEDERRAYMRDYMRNYRDGKPSVNNVKSGKPALAKLTQADAASDTCIKEADISRTVVRDDRQNPAGGCGEVPMEWNGTERKGNIPKRARETGLPANEKEAVEWASMEAVPEQFARDIFNQLEGVNWLDGSKRPITNWRRYIKGRYSRGDGQTGQPASGHSGSIRNAGESMDEFTKRAVRESL